MADEMKTYLSEIEAELVSMSWESAKPGDAMTHFTGRGEKWTVQLVVLAYDDLSTNRMATGAAGSVVMKLTDELCIKAEAVARHYLRARL